MAQVGDVDLAFNTGGIGPDDDIKEIVRLPDGKYMIRGDFTHYNGQSAPNIARLNQDGTLDTGFDMGTGPNGPVLCFDVSADGSIMIGGGFSTVNGIARNGLAKLNSDGSVATDFDPNAAMATLELLAGIDFGIKALALDTNCHVVFSDNMVFTSTHLYNNINRVTSSGALDPTFTPARTTNLVGSYGIWPPDIMKVRPDGKIVMSGAFGVINSQQATRFGMLESNGTVIPTPPIVSFAALGLTVLSDNSILWNGTVNTNYPGLLRILPDGSRDMNFNPGGAGPDSRCYATQPMPDGSLMTVGDFSTFNGVTRPGIALLTPNGLLDTTFVPMHTGPLSGVPWGVAVDLDRRPIIVGSFTDYGSTTADHIVRLQHCALGNTCVPDTAPFCIDEYRCGCYYPPEPFYITLHVMLEGAYRSNQFLMGDELRTGGFLPTTEPYTNLVGFSHVGHGGGESTTSNILSTTDIIDWVLLELRDPNDPTMVTQTRSALIRSNGQVVDMDGVSPVEFNGEGSGDAHLAVRHRNHLGVMTQSTFPFAPATSTSIDLRFGTVPIWGNDGMVQHGPLWYLWAGDVNGDGTLKYIGTDNDRDDILIEIGGAVPTNVASGYRSADVTMDGSTSYIGSLNDRDPILVNIGGNTPTNVRSAQLP